MARQITILETVKASVDGEFTIRGAFWFPVATVAARVPKPQFLSVLFQVPPPNNITAAEQAMLESGETLEETFVITAPISATQAQLKAQLIARWTDRAAAVTALPPTRQFYGVFYNGTVWSS